MGLALTEGFQLSFSWLVGKRCGFLQGKWLYWEAFYRCWGFSWSAKGTVMWPNRRPRYQTAIQPEEEETNHTLLWDPVRKLIIIKRHRSLYSHAALGNESLGTLLWTLLMPTETKMSVHWAGEMASSILQGSHLCFYLVNLFLSLIYSDFWCHTYKDDTWNTEMTPRKPPMAPDYSLHPLGPLWLVQPMGTTLPLISPHTRS